MAGGPASVEPADPFGLVGTLLDSKYRIDRVVAEGGFGVVYAGLHLALHAPIAVKVLRRGAGPEAGAWADLLASFLQEARTVARLRHPNIVAVLDVGVSAREGLTVPWMVLEWLEGPTLLEELAQRRGRGGRSPAECLTLLRPI